MPTFTRWQSPKPITEQFSKQANDAFRTISYTIGGMMDFPGNQIDRKLTAGSTRINDLKVPSNQKKTS